MRWSIMLALLVCGCSNPGDGPFALATGDLGQTQKIEAGRLGGGLYRVEVAAKRFADETTRQDYALFKAAQVTKQAGRTHFLVVRGASEKTNGLSLISSGDTDRYVVFFRVLEKSGAAGAPANALSADELIYFLGKRFARKTD